jgi:hypothetical protein
MNTKTSLFIGIITGVMISLVLTAFGIWPKQHVSYEDAKLAVIKYEAMSKMHEIAPTFTNDKSLPWSDTHVAQITDPGGLIHPSADIWWETIYIANEKYYVVSNGSDIEVIKP